MNLTKGNKKINQTNPIMTQRFGADPYAMEYNGRIYVYMTNDILDYNEQGELKDNNFSKINTINCVSSSDLVNWTDHGSMPIAGANGAAKWAKNSWAPAAAHKTINGKEKFFLYFADSGRGIGVVSSDTPIGPWVDPIDGPLVSTQTENCSDVLWCFDPAVLVDGDRAFFYFGGGVPKDQAAMPNTARAVELGEDMISIKGVPVRIEAPYIFEDSGINKIGDTYYYSYCSNFSERNDPTAKYVLEPGEINYMTSKNPLGPFTYQKSILPNPGFFFGDGGNNHHCFIEFKGDYYMFWHTQTLKSSMNLSAGGYRCTHVDKMKVNEDGTIDVIQASFNGVEQLCGFDPYVEHSTDTFAWEAGTNTIPCEDDSTKMQLCEIHTGDYIGIAGVEFGTKGANSITITAASKQEGCEILVCLDSPNNEPLTTITVPCDQELSQLSASITTITGNHHVFFVFKGSDISFEAWKFIQA